MPTYFIYLPFTACYLIRVTATMKLDSLVWNSNSRTIKSTSAPLFPTYFFFSQEKNYRSSSYRKVPKRKSAKKNSQSKGRKKCYLKVKVFLFVCSKQTKTKPQKKSFSLCYSINITLFLFFLSDHLPHTIHSQVIWLD